MARVYANFCNAVQNAVTAHNTKAIYNRASKADTEREGRTICANQRSANIRAYLFIYKARTVYIVQFAQKGATAFVHFVECNKNLQKRLTLSDVYVILYLPRNMGVVH